MSTIPKPRVRSGVDLQLRNAFQDGNWQQAARLADKRAKALKDPYYQALSVASQSQMDSPQDKSAVLSVVEESVRKGTVIKDPDIIDLYEWACWELIPQSRYSETHGQLRLRLVKAAPRDKETAMDCLRLALMNWDLVNAQQIAAILDKTFVAERDFLFWNTLITFMLSTSEQCPPEKKKLYSVLALRQLQRAAEMREKGPVIQDRAIKTEEEQLLYFRVLATHGTKDELLRQFNSPVLGAITSFHEGSKYLFLQALDTFEQTQDQKSIFEMCSKVFGKTVGDNLNPLNLIASDWSVWKRFIRAAASQVDDEGAFTRINEILEPYVSRREALPPVYSRIISLSILETTFRMSTPSTTPQGSPRIRQICQFIELNYDKRACFDDIRCFVEELSSAEAKLLLTESLPNFKTEGKKRKLFVTILILKLRYLVLSSPQSKAPVISTGDKFVRPLFICKLCEQKITSTCMKCLRSVVIQSMDERRQNENDTDVNGALRGEDVDPFQELTMTAAMSLIKLSGIHDRKEVPLPSLAGVDMGYFLQAVALLDDHLSRHPDNSPLRVFLVHIYLLLGCPSYAQQIWAPLGVKRTIQDSLSPLFFDRISTIGPGLFRTGPGTKEIVEPMRAYYKNCLKYRAPNVIWHALEAGSYTSVLGIADYMHNLRHSCTVVMAVVEERKGLRALYGKADSDISQTPLIASIMAQTNLVVATDYGSFPDLESSHATPIMEVLRLGPGLSNTRSHLDLLTEQYLELITHTPPKEYKPAKPHEVSAKDKSYILETFDRLHESLTTFLQHPSTPDQLTSAEDVYYTIISLLSAILPAILCLTKQSPLPVDIAPVVETITTTITLATEDLEDTVPSPTLSGAKPANFAFLSFGALHGTSLLLSSASAIRLTTTFLQTYQKAQLAHDKSGKSALPKTVLPLVKTLEDAADNATKVVKQRVKDLKEAMDESSWMDRLAGWAFGSVAVDIDEAELEEFGEGVKDEEVVERVFEGIGGIAGCETWGGRVLESWRLGVRGWGMVRME